MSFTTGAAAADALGRHILLLKLGLTAHNSDAPRKSSFFRCSSPCLSRTEEENDKRPTDSYASAAVCICDLVQVINASLCLVVVYTICGCLSSLVLRTASLCLVFISRTLPSPTEPLSNRGNKYWRCYLPALHHKKLRGNLWLVCWLPSCLVVHHPGHMMSKKKKITCDVITSA